MPTPEQYSESNLLNSLAVYLASKLLADGYLVYYHKRDVLQTGTTVADWWYQYSQNRATYEANSGFVAKINAAKGIVTLVDGLPAEPRFVTRLISDSSVGPQDEVPVPALSLEVTAELLQEAYELGSTLMWRTRHLVVDGYVRSPAEQGYLKDRLAVWFQLNTRVEIADYDSGSATPAVLGTIEVDRTRVDAARFVDQAQAMTYQVLANAFVVYVA